MRQLCRFKNTLSRAQRGLAPTKRGAFPRAPRAICACFLLLFSLLSRGTEKQKERPRFPVHSRGTLAFLRNTGKRRGFPRRSSAASARNRKGESSSEQVLQFKFIIMHPYGVSQSQHQHFLTLLLENIKAGSGRFFTSSTARARGFPADRRTPRASVWNRNRRTAHPANP